MKKKYIIIVFVAIIASSFSFAQNRSIEFEKGNWSEIIAKAKNENKLIFFDAYASWCGPCKMLAKVIFTNDTVADFYNSNFVCAKIDMEKGEGVNLAKKYGVKVYPTLLFINGDGEIVHKFIGGTRSAKVFVKRGLRALNPFDNLLFYDKNYENKTTLSPEFTINYLELLAYTPKKDEVLNKYLKTQSLKDIQSETNKEIIFKYIDNFDSREFKFMVENIDMFSKHFSKNIVTDRIENVYLSALAKLIYVKEFDISKFDEVSKKIKEQNYIYVDKILSRADMILYKRQKDWKSYAEIAINSIDKYYLEDYAFLNEVAWDFYEHIDDVNLLKKAKKWAGKSVELFSDDSNNDTYAAVLFKLGENEEAIKYEKKAIEIAKKKGRSIEGYQKMLEKMNKN